MQQQITSGARDTRGTGFMVNGLTTAPQASRGELEKQQVTSATGGTTAWVDPTNSPATTVKVVIEKRILLGTVLSDNLLPCGGVGFYRE
jgi:hypothetical protein